MIDTATHKEFIKNGFQQDADPFFLYKKYLVSEEDCESLGLQEDEIPQLLFGRTAQNSGFCIYTGGHFIWLNCQTVMEAVEISQKITAFEAV